MHAELRHRQRHGDEAGLKRAEEGHDVVQTLRCHDRRPIAGRAVQAQLIGQDQRLAVELGPGQRLGLAGAGHLRVHKDVRQGVGGLGGTLQQQSRQ